MARKSADAGCLERIALCWTAPVVGVGVGVGALSNQARAQNHTLILVAEAEIFGLMEKNPGFAF